MSEGKRVEIHMCHGVTDEMVCRFNGACYGEICIAPATCSKKELTAEEQVEVDAFNKEHGL